MRKLARPGKESDAQREPLLPGMAHDVLPEESSFDAVQAMIGQQKGNQAVPTGESEDSRKESIYTLKKARVRRMKAQLIVDIDKKLGQPTPQRILKIAEGKSA